tara:strand:- start:266 stop:820 length:555 start_codon:yes stop_codon:yes gene_type:complete
MSFNLLKEMIKEIILVESNKPSKELEKSKYALLNGEKVEIIAADGPGEYSIVRKKNSDNEEFALMKDLKPLKNVNERRDPKVGTGKKPKGSGRRLYTDENPNDTVRVKFRTASDIRKTLSKKTFKSKSHARQSQIINLIHQRVRAAYKNAKDPKVKARLKRAYEYACERKEASKRKTLRIKKKK